MSEDRESAREVLPFPSFCSTAHSCMKAKVVVIHYYCSAAITTRKRMNVSSWKYTFPQSRRASIIRHVNTWYFPRAKACYTYYTTWIGPRLSKLVITNLFGSIMLSSIQPCKDPICQAWIAVLRCIWFMSSNLPYNQTRREFFKL